MSSMIRTGAIGAWSIHTPNGPRAFSTAETTAPATGMTPASPAPLTPSGLSVDGVSTWIISKFGTVVEDGNETRLWHSIRVYTFTEIEMLLQAVGLRLRPRPRPEGDHPRPSPAACQPGGAPREPVPAETDAAGPSRRRPAAGSRLGRPRNPRRLATRRRPRLQRQGPRQQLRPAKSKGLFCFLGMLLPHLAGDDRIPYR